MINMAKIMSLKHDPSENQLLAALPPAERVRLLPHLQLVEMSLEVPIYAPFKQIQHAYFPTSMIVSLLHVMESGATTELGLIGKEGIAGVPLFMGTEVSTNWAVVQSAGYAYRLSGHILKKEFARSGTFQHLLLCYAQTLMAQISQTAVCNRHHTLSQQLCRWLLLNIDRLPDNQLNMTQELIANMLGVRREGVTEAAGAIQREGLIRYSRGRITVLDRAGLEKRVCECYRTVVNETDRIMNNAYKK